MFKICGHQLKAALTAPRVLAALFFGCVIQIASVMPLFEFSKQIAKPLCLFEGFVCYSCDTPAVCAASFGIFLLVADIPFLSRQESYVLLRVTRRRWVSGKTLSLFCMCVLYHLAALLSGVFFLLENTYIANFWSEPARLLAKGAADGIFLTERVLLLPPFAAAAASFALSVAYSFVISLFLFSLSLKLGRVLSFFCTALLHISGYLTAFLLLSKQFLKFSLLANSFLMFHRLGSAPQENAFPTLLQSFLLFGVLASGLVFLLQRAIRRYEFPAKAGLDQ